jgi:hypothetical protein
MYRYLVLEIHHEHLNYLINTSGEWQQNIRFTGVELVRDNRIHSATEILHALREACAVRMRTIVSSICGAGRRLNQLVDGS